MSAETNQPQDPQTEPVAEHTPQHESASQEVEKARQEAAELRDKYLRLMADFENLRRRSAKEAIEVRKLANEDLLKALLPILDDFERAAKALQAESATLQTAQEGFGLIHHKMVRTLAQKGLKEMPEAKGQDFDMELHEAITQIPAPDESLKGKVVDVVEKGYFLEDKVIRFAKVVVGS